MLQKKLDKARAEDTELWAKKLALMERTSHFHGKYYALFSLELCFHKQLGVLSEKKKKMFARELVFIKDLKGAEQEVSGGVRLSDNV